MTSVYVPPLTAAEQRVLDFLPTHLTANQIADELACSHNTVKSHIRSIYLKLGACNRSEAVRAAVRHDLLTQQSVLAGKAR